MLQNERYCRYGECQKKRLEEQAGAKTCKTLYAQQRKSKFGIESTKGYNTEEISCQIVFYQDHKYGGQIKGSKIRGNENHQEVTTVTLARSKEPEKETDRVNLVGEVLETLKLFLLDFVVVG